MASIPSYANMASIPWEVGLIYEMTKLFAKAGLQNNMITVITLKEAFWCILQALKELKIRQLSVPNNLKI